LWRTWFFLGIVSLATQPPACERQNAPAGPPELLVGQRVSWVITSRDRPCSGSFAPCRVFQVSANQTGVLLASLTFESKTNGLRLEVWNGNNGHGTCCHSGESVSIAVAKGDRAEMDVVLEESRAENARQPFKLDTSIQESQQ